jgi:hypothetical protein
MLASLKKGWRGLRRGRPGHRFQERYQRNRQTKGSKSVTHRFVMPLVGVILVIAGIVLCVFPGPGIPLIILGASFLAERSRTIARSMDWSELKIRQGIKWALLWWRKASLPARCVALVLITGVSAVGAYGAYRMLFDRQA